MTSGWGIFTDLRKENELLEQQAERTPPVACRKCGMLLQVRASDGVRNCPAGDWRWSP